MKKTYKYKNNYVINNQELNDNSGLYCEEIEAFDINNRNLNIHNNYTVREISTTCTLQPRKHTFYFDKFLNENKNNVRYVRHLIVCVDKNNKEFRTAIYYVAPKFKNDVRHYPNCIYKNYPNDFIKDFNLA